jgi:hypothetical protein
MPRLRFEGYSDDTFGEYGHTNEDVDNCASGKPIEFLVTAGDESLVVVGQYAPGNAGGWLVGVAPYDPEGVDAPVPPWPMRFERGDAPYSPALVIEAPEGVKVKPLKRRK